MFDLFFLITENTEHGPRDYAIFAARGFKPFKKQIILRTFNLKISVIYNIFSHKMSNLILNNMKNIIYDFKNSIYTDLKKTKRLKKCLQILKKLIFIQKNSV